MGNCLCTNCSNHIQSEDDKHSEETRKKRTKKFSFSFLKKRKKQIKKNQIETENSEDDTIERSEIIKEEKKENSIESSNVNIDDKGNENIIVKHTNTDGTTMTTKENDSNMIDENNKVIEDNSMEHVSAFVDDLLWSSILIVYDLVTIVEESVIDNILNWCIEQLLWKPFGFANPKGYCYLNSVIHILVSCNDFYQEFNTFKSWDTLEKNNDFLFVKGLSDLICSLKKEKENGVKEALKDIQNHVTESSSGDDVYKCFMNILTRVSNVIKTSTNVAKRSSETSSGVVNSKADIHYEKFRNKNPGFVFDNFYGLLSFQIRCKDCSHICNESFQMIKSLPLPVPKSKETVKLETCIELFFNDSDIDTDDPMECKCKTPSINLKSYTSFFRCPKYLFAYLNRGSYFQHGDKNRTNVTCENIINIKTNDGNSNEYNLISVIDHVGSSDGGHYYCKCSFETDKWWLLNDTQVTKLRKDEKIVTNNTIAFMFKRSC